MAHISTDQLAQLRAALTMAAGGERDPRIEVRGDAYTVNGGDSYVRDPRVAGVYAALAVLDTVTPVDDAPLAYAYDVLALEAMTVDELRDLAREHGLALSPGYVTKAELITALTGLED